MPRFAANLSMMYTELPFLARFGAAAADGFEAVEYLFPYAFPPEAIVAELTQHRLTQALFNLPPGDWDAGERGLACHPGREAEFADSVQQALRYARATGCLRLHAMAGLLPAAVVPEQARDTYLTNLRLAARAVAAEGITLLIEPINSRDMPGYFLSLQQQAADVLREVGEPNLKIQFDCYHCQIMEGDLSRRFEKHLPDIGHVQIAGVPDRHEPDQGELNYPHLFDHFDRLGYSGFVGCEYRPRAKTSDGLGWLRPYLSQRSV